MMVPVWGIVSNQGFAIVSLRMEGVFPFYRYCLPMNAFTIANIVLIVEAMMYEGRHLLRMRFAH